ncbi:MAG: hypothetical protein H6850_00545 [Alphaproteobacteria bacterium]|nr:MAG: hypothetical protein H6850_00545 [Alphaproteobacteria bacterium]
MPEVARNLTDYIKRKNDGQPFSSDDQIKLEDWSGAFYALVYMVQNPQFVKTVNPARTSELKEKSDTREVVIEMIDEVLQPVPKEIFSFGTYSQDRKLFLQHLGHIVHAYLLLLEAQKRGEIRQRFVEEEVRQNLQRLEKYKSSEGVTVELDIVQLKKELENARDALKLRLDSLQKRMEAQRASADRGFSISDAISLMFLVPVFILAPHVFSTKEDNEADLKRAIDAAQKKIDSLPETVRVFSGKASAAVIEFLEARFKTMQSLLSALGRVSALYKSQIDKMKAIHSVIGQLDIGDIQQKMKEFKGAFEAFDSVVSVSDQHMFMDIQIGACRHVVSQVECAMAGERFECPACGEALDMEALELFCWKGLEESLADMILAEKRAQEEELRKVLK